MWVSLERVGEDSTDTSKGNAVLFQLGFYYLAWNNGAYHVMLGGRVDGRGV